MNGGWNETKIYPGIMENHLFFRSFPIINSSAQTLEAGLIEKTPRPTIFENGLGHKFWLIFVLHFTPVSQASISWTESRFREYKF